MNRSTEAQEKRDLAMRARRYAAAVTLEADRQRLLQWAVELEKEARHLEDRYRAPPPTGAEPDG